MKLNDEQLKNTITAIMKSINEETIAGDTGANPQAYGVETSDENLTFAQMYQELAKPSLARSMLSTKPLSGPTGAIFNVRKNVTGGIELLRSNVEVYPSNPIKTGISQEALQDLFNGFGVEGVRALSTVLQGLATDDENEKFLAFLETNAVADTETFQLVSQNSKDSFYELTKRVSKSVLKMNLDAVKTFRAGILLPYSLASSVMGFSACDKIASTGTFYVGGTELHDYYINPDPTSTDIFVMLMDQYDGSKGAGVYSPYQNFINITVDPETGSPVYFIYNRFALGISPLHSVDTPSIVKISYIE